MSVLSEAPAGSIELSLTMQWQPFGDVISDANGSLLFATAPNKPGVYRFRLIGADVVGQYIGETENLRRRFYHYRNPGPSQATNVRMNDKLKDHLAAGGQVAIDYVAIADIRFTIGNVPVPVDLKSKPIRRLLEQAALVATGGKAIDSLNR